MKQYSHSMFHRVLCATLSILLVVTVTGISEGVSATVASHVIEEGVIPLASAPQEGESERASDEASVAYELGGAVSDEHLVSKEEAVFAEEERASDPSELGYVPGELVVVYESSASESDKESSIEVVDGESSVAEATFEESSVVSVEISDDLTVETAAELLENDPAVRYALPNYIFSTCDEPVVAVQGAASLKVDDRRSSQWYLDYVKAPAAWDILAAHASSIAPVKVAVVDTGVSLSHPDLANVVNRAQSVEVVHGDIRDLASWRIEPLRGDGYVNGSSSVEEYASHGTHVAGIIGAEAGNGGILGVASGGTTACGNKLVDLVAIDAFSEKAHNGVSWIASGELYDVVFALMYARDAGCRVVNLSLGFDQYDEKLESFFEELCRELTEKNDMLIVAAAGNAVSGSADASQMSIPAVCDSVLGVISLTHRNNANPNRSSIAEASWITGDVTRSAFSYFGD